MTRFDEDPSGVDPPTDSGEQPDSPVESPEGAAPLFRRFASGDPESVSVASAVIGRVVRTKGYYVPLDQRPDVIQEAMTDLVRATKQSKFANDAEFVGFIRVVTYRRCIDWLRQVKRRARIEPGIMQLVLPDDALTSRERHHLAVEVFSQLRKSCREVLALKIGRGLTHGQVAGLLGRSEGALRTQVSHCLKQARILLNRLQRRRKLVRLTDWRKKR